MAHWHRPRSASRRFAIAGAASLVALLLLGTPESAPTATKKTVFAAVASRSVPVDEVSLAELRQMFLLEKRFWKKGQPLVALYPASGSATRAFVLERLCRSTEGEMRHMILEKMYRGEIDLAPKVVNSDTEAVSFIAAGRGLVAIVPADMVTGESIKVLRIDGRPPYAAGYALAE
jgi:hypothetical protein